MVGCFFQGDAMDLFQKGDEQPLPDDQPLAARMRPREIDEVVGQVRILGPGKLLRRAIEADRLSSIVLYGPPGSGKTSLAEVIARVTRRHFERTSGAVANVAELRDVIARARHRLGGLHGDSDDGKACRGTILFVDEIHRFNKAQQDVLLPHVEDGTVTLVGATTHNPSIFINSALTSRSLVFELSALSEDAILCLLRRALEDERGFAALHVDADQDALAHLARVCEGDARRALNALEIAVLTTTPGKNGSVHLDEAACEASIQKKVVRYDQDEDGHYDTISAFIKSLRGSDPHAAVYWLAKMLYAGEDPRFIARRLVILASEDVGNADPRALTVAVSAMRAVEFVGMPEARIVLSQATTYLATTPKSNASYKAIAKAEADVKEGRVLDVPVALKNVKPKTVGGESKEYLYPHDFDGHFVDQSYIPTATRYYEPSCEGYEETIARRMAAWDEMRAEARKRQSA